MGSTARLSTPRFFRRAVARLRRGVPDRITDQLGSVDPVATATALRYDWRFKSPSNSRQQGRNASMSDTPIDGAAEAQNIVVRGARTQKLMNIDLTLPVGQLIIVTGVSGSGRHSLAFDTIYAEVQRLYVESLPASAVRRRWRMVRQSV